MDGNKEAEVTQAGLLSYANRMAKQVAAIKYLASQAGFWARQGLQDRPLESGAHALLFISESMIKRIEAREDFTALQCIAVRHRVINKIYQLYIRRLQYKQILILGAGFDIRAHKKSPENQAGKKYAAQYQAVKFFEVDSAYILDEKEKKFTEAAKDKNATYIRANYREDTWLEKLKENGVDFKAPTLIIWEDNSYYHELAEIKQLMQNLKSYFEQFTIVFDYFMKFYIDEQRALNPDIPWKTGFDDVNAFANEQGLTLVKNERLDSLMRDEGLTQDLDDLSRSYAVCTMHN